MRKRWEMKDERDEREEIESFIHSFIHPFCHIERKNFSYLIFVICLLKGEKDKVR